MTEEMKIHKPWHIKTHRQKWFCFNSFCELLFSRLRNMEKLLSTVYDINKLWMWRAWPNFDYEWAFRKLGEALQLSSSRGEAAGPMFIIIWTNYVSMLSWKFTKVVLMNGKWWNCCCSCNFQILQLCILLKTVQIQFWNTFVCCWTQM